MIIYLMAIPYIFGILVDVSHGVNCFITTVLPNVLQHAYITHIADRCLGNDVPNLIQHWMYHAI